MRVTSFRKALILPGVLLFLLFLLLLLFLTACTSSPDLTSKAPSSGENPPIQMASGSTAAAGPLAAESPGSDPTVEPTSTPAPIPTETFDIVLVGSELEGLYLARAAADEGLSVKIIDTREAFGGQLLQGEMLFLDEAKDGSNKTLLQGRVRELFTGFKNGSIRKLSEYEQYVQEQLVRDLPVESGIQIEQVLVEPDSSGEETLKSLTYRAKDDSIHRIQADYFVDNTDHAALLSRLKSTRLPGMEALWKLDRIEYMAAGMMMKFKNVDWNKFNTHFNSLSSKAKREKYGIGWVNETFALGLSGMTERYKPSNERVFLRGLNALYQRDGEVIINALLVFDVDPSEDASIEEAVRLGHEEMPGILEHFRNSIVGWENTELNGLARYPYIREYNHYEMKYVLEASDLFSGRMFWDNVSIAGYPLDLQGISVAKWGTEVGRPDKYGMPLRSFQLKNYTNVLAAGKNVGASVIAYGSARIQPNTSLAGETIGIILGQIHGKKQLNDLNEADMKELHQLLAEQYNIKLTGIEAVNKLAIWTDEEIAKLNTGEIIFSQYIPKAAR